MPVIKPISELDFGFEDAQSYKTSQDSKDLFDKLFLYNEYVDAIIKPNNFFLVGEKGTGKTAYAIYLSTHEHRNHKGQTVFVQDTDYQKFLDLKESRDLSTADYIEIWKSIILLLIAEKISEDEPELIGSATQFRALKNAIDQFYMHAFRPEIYDAFQFIESSKESAQLIFEHIRDASSHIVFSEAKFKLNLSFIQKQFEDVISFLPLKKSHILFIDGIDVRPPDLQYRSYMECVKGLTNAVWSLNTNVLTKLKNKNMDIKVMLLIRPDIIDAVGLHNLNNKLKDNSVILDWRTTYRDYRHSNLFKMADQMLRGQQNSPESFQHGDAWDLYFPYKGTIPSGRNIPDPSFIPFLRYSFYKPRDIVSLLRIMKKRFDAHNPPDSTAVFNYKDFKNSQTQRLYSEYLLGEVKEGLSFYYQVSDYELFLKFFEYLSKYIKGKRFYYDDFVKAYNKLIAYMDENQLTKPYIFETADTFLQFLYELNIVGFVYKITQRGQSRETFSWSFKERSYANIRPKVQTHRVYLLHAGIATALKV